MFDIAWSEFMVVAVVALVVVGPRDLPALLRTVGKTVASLRRMAGEFQSQFNEAMREAELDDLKREVTGLKDHASKLMGPNPIQIARDELKNAWDKPAPSALSGETPATAPAADVPSALAPPPVIEPTPEPPAPVEADFAPTPEPEVAAAEPEPKPKRARKAASRANGASKPDDAAKADEPADPPPGAAA